MAAALATGKPIPEFNIKAFNEYQAKYVTCERQRIGGDFVIAQATPTR